MRLSSKMRDNLLITAWILSIIAGFAVLENYKNQPGEPAEPKFRWPNSSSLSHSTSRPTLVMFAHPRCPCTDASLSELSQFVGEHPKDVDVQIAFYTPSTKSDAWLKTRAWRFSKNLGATVLTDVDGKEANKFGAKTSGQIFLYSKSGDLLFSGGITGARGHIGPNEGGRSLASALESGKPVHNQAKVFGCSLFHNGHEDKLLEEKENYNE